MRRDEEIFKFIDDESNRQHCGLELIASENYVSDQVLEADGSICTNKYAEGYPAHRYYGGCEVIDEIESLAIERLKKIYGADWVNVQPHSGAQANMAVELAILKPGDTLMGLDLSQGGHLTHGSAVNISGKIFNAVTYGLNKEGYVDYDQMENIAFRYRPKLIIGGASAYSREWDYERMRAIADKVGAILMIDMAHTAGLIAAGILRNPLPFAHIVTSTTHKTLRGPRGGIILLGKDFKHNGKMMSKILDSSVFPGIQGGPLEHIIAAKAVAFWEALQPEFKEYQQQVVLNARTMADEFIRLGYHIVSGGTDNHLMLIDLRTKYPELTGKQVETELGKVDITVNKNMVPNDSRTAAHTSGIRVGTPAVTTRGFKENDMKDIVNLIDFTLANALIHLTGGDDETYEMWVNEIKERVHNLTKDKPLNAY